MMKLCYESSLFHSHPRQSPSSIFVFLSMQLTALDLAAVDIGKGHNHGINLIGQGWFANFFFFSSLVEMPKSF